MAPGPEVTKTTPGLVTSGVAFGRVGRGLFVANGDMADFVLLENLVVNREDGATGVSKDCVHTLILQGLNYYLGAGHLTGHRIYSIFRGCPRFDYKVTVAATKKPLIAGDGVCPTMMVRI